MKYRAKNHGNTRSHREAKKRAYGRFFLRRFFGHSKIFMRYHKAINALIKSTDISVCMSVDGTITVHRIRDPWRNHVIGRFTVKTIKDCIAFLKSVVK